MASIPRISVIHSDYQTQIRRFSVQSVNDLVWLPRYGIKGSGDTVMTIRSTAVGSRAFVRDTGATYELNSENKWQKIIVTSSGGGGSTGGDTGDDNEYVDKDDVDSLFPDTPTNPDTDSSVDDETLILPDSNGTVEDETWVIG